MLSAQLFYIAQCSMLAPVAEHTHAHMAVCARHHGVVRIENVQKCSRACKARDTEPLRVRRPRRAAQSRPVPEEPRMHELKRHGTNLPLRARRVPCTLSRETHCSYTECPVHEIARRHYFLSRVYIYWPRMYTHAVLLVQRITIARLY